MLNISKLNRYIISFILVYKANTNIRRKILNFCLNFLYLRKKAYNILYVFCIIDETFSKLAYIIGIQLIIGWLKFLLLFSCKKFTFKKLRLVNISSTYFNYLLIKWKILVSNFTHIFIKSTLNLFIYVIFQYFTSKYWVNKLKSLKGSLFGLVTIQI
jgi:hypothetical protein